MQARCQAECKAQHYAQCKPQCNAQCRPASYAQCKAVQDTVLSTAQCTVKEKERKVYAVRRHTKSPCDQSQPGVAEGALLGTNFGKT